MPTAIATEAGGKSDGPDSAVQQQCISAAKRTQSQAWTCVGGALTAQVIGAKGANQLLVKQFGSGAAEMTPAPAAGTAGILADDYDSWCETGSVCGRKISDYTAEVKGNGVYGVGSQVVGRLDIVYRQTFNGYRPRWRGLLIWDSGPTVRPRPFYAYCRINRTGTDGFCGNITFSFAAISSTSWRAWSPSSTGFHQLGGNPLVNGTEYHDDLYGSFTADGYSQIFYAATIHTGRWRQCNPNCKYYQVPWAP